MELIVLAALFATLLMEYNVSGEHCRFDRTAASRGNCIFPCQCNGDCDQVTGKCLNDGQCHDGQPRGYKWSGPACQIGNIALNKNASQSTAKWGEKYPASKAVDGKIDRLSYQYCAVPNAVSSSNIWWKVDFGAIHKITHVIIYNTNTVFVEASHCPVIEKRARDRCGAAGINQLQCQAEAEGCCWDEEARGSDIACYKNLCKVGYFGWKCRFRCDKCSTTCDPVTGKCPSTCKDNRWGVGCMLSEGSYFDDQRGKYYLGPKSSNEDKHDCLAWTLQTKKNDSTFPEGSRKAAGNYCRNPDNDKRPWCYNKVRDSWTFCDIKKQDCDVGRFGRNCENECHCRNFNETCQKNKGHCVCDPHFTGNTCQECKAGYFGVFCDGTCHCRTGNCDKTTGHCPGECAAGWTGLNCQTDLRRLNSFTLSVGNSSDVNVHTQCASHNGTMAAEATVNESCTSTGRYLSFRQNRGGENYLATLCEVVVIGHEYISCRYCSSSTCNNVIGCDACAPGKQQPNCVNDCIDKTYGVNCNESCGYCKERSECSITNGSCPNGCETWYSSDVCKTHIALPGYQSTRPDVDDVTNSSTRVSWPKATNISSGLEDHYHYVLWLQVDGEREINVTRVVQGAGEQQMEARITGLTYNTNYSLRVEPYREHNEVCEGGASTEVVAFKTRCKAPSVPAIEQLTIAGRTTNARIVLKWQTINESGCDYVASVQVQYKQATTHDSWISLKLDTVTETKVIIDNLSSERYELRLVVINNENIKSVSEIKTVYIKKAGRSLSPGGIAGTVVGVTVLLAGLSVVIIIIFLRRRRNGTSNRAGVGQINGGLDDVANEPADDDVEYESVEDTGVIYANVRGVKLADLAAFVEQKKHHSGFTKEFGELPPGARASCDAANKQENKNKNRFINILAYDHTRVVLSTNNGKSDYINASRILGYGNQANAYIATQGPKSWTIEDMWRMVWQENTNMIVMLANLYELGKEKCSQYWPDKGQPKTWGNFIVERSNEEQFADYVIREFTLKNQELKKMRKIRQFHFTAWPDKGTPEYPYPLLAFHRKVRISDSDRRGPLLVHCSAGVGRTGTFIAIDILTKQAAAEGMVDVFQCVDSLRTQRVNMVQTQDQYVYVFQALVDASEDSVIPCSQLKQSFDELCKGTNLNKQFKRLGALNITQHNKKIAALEPKNVDKNRDIEIIPDDNHRPYLLTPWKECTNYINAVYVDGYKQRNAYILTQSPMTTTVVDLWRLLNDQESHAVIMVDDIDDSDGNAIYWPSKKEPKCQYGPFQVELSETNFGENSNITTRDFKVTKSSKPEDGAVVVRQFHLKRNTWQKSQSVPRDKTVLLDLLDLVEKWQQQSGNGRITIHCSDGASRCGLVCAASYILEHLKIEQEVDVFHAVQHIRTTRPQLVTDLGQYRFLYEVALAYMCQFDTYANFQ